VQSGDVFGDIPDPFFRPAWEDAPEETEQPRLWRRKDCRNFGVMRLLPLTGVGR
jgi:hypothetical protein